MTRCGFVSLAGRPNVGKSTLVNALVGEKVSIVSDRPQTTRRLIRGAVTDAGGTRQAVLCDLPGVQRPRDRLTGRMQRRVTEELAEADAILLVIDADAGVGPGDRFIAGTLLAGRAGSVPIICAVNKCDRLKRPQIAAALAEAAELPGIDELFPVSAKRGEVDELREHLLAVMPEGPLMFPAAGAPTDQPEQTQLAELIREQVLRRTWQEIPHAVEVQVIGVGEAEDGRPLIEAEIWVEAASQKGMLIGKQGRMIRQVGTAARKEIERKLGGPAHLSLEVRHRPAWRADSAALDRLGIE